MFNFNKVVRFGLLELGHRNLSMNKEENLYKINLSTELNLFDY